MWKYMAFPRGRNPCKTLIFFLGYCIKLNSARYGVYHILLIIAWTLFKFVLFGQKLWPTKNDELSNYLCASEMIVFSVNKHIILFVSVLRWEAAEVAQRAQ